MNRFSKYTLPCAGSIAMLVATSAQASPQHGNSANQFNPTMSLIKTSSPSNSKAALWYLEPISF